MSKYKTILSFLAFISLIIGASNIPAYSHVLSDNPPDFWKMLDEDFYDSINNDSCDIDELNLLKKNIVNRRNKIKSRTKHISRIKLSLASIETRINSLLQITSDLKYKLIASRLEDKKRNKILAKIKWNKRKSNHLQQHISRQENLINNKQKQIDSIRPMLNTAENKFANINVECGSVAGVWQSEGYGYVVELIDRRFRSYNVTSDICIRDKFYDKDGSIFDNFDFYQIASDAREIRVALQDDIPFEFTFRRIDALPSQCLSALRNSPTGNFEAFVSFFDEHYPFFDLYDVDWDTETSKAGVLVNKDTDDQALFDILTNMLVNVKDGHISLEATIDGEEVDFDAHPFDIDIAIAEYADRKGIDVDVADDLFLDNYLFNDIENHILGGTSFSDPEEIVYYGMTNGDIGHIAITEEDIIGDDPLEDIELTDAFMDDALTYFKANKAKAVIIDLSINYGGFDSVARTIAERFAAEPTFAYAKRAGDFSGATDIDIVIEASSRERYLGPVYLVTSEATISAGEILVMSLRALPNVTHVGEPTNGALSDQLEKELPNGWIISLSSEIYTDHNGIEWESLGIEPDILMSIFDLEKPLGSAHRDAIDALIELIDEEYP